MKIKSYKSVNNTINIEDFEIPKNETTIIFGRNGSGKTSLVNSIAFHSHNTQDPFYRAKVRAQSLFDSTSSFKIEIQNIKNVQIINWKYINNFHNALEQIKKLVNKNFDSANELSEKEIKNLNSIFSNLPNFEYEVRFLKYTNPNPEIGIYIECKKTKKKINFEDDIFKELSESEKGRIKVAILYKLAEITKGNSDEEVVLILDDPINSMDEHIQLEYVKHLVESKNTDVTLLIFTHSFETLMLFHSVLTHSKIKDYNMLILDEFINTNLAPIASHEINIIKWIIQANFNIRIQEIWNVIGNKEKLALTFFWRDSLLAFLSQSEEINVSKLFKVEKLDEWIKFTNLIKPQNNLTIDNADTPLLNDLSLNPAISIKENFIKIKNSKSFAGWEEYKILNRIIENLLDDIENHFDNATNVSYDIRHTPSKHIGRLATKIPNSKK